MATITKAEIYEGSIVIWLFQQPDGYPMAMTIPCATRKDRADMEDRLLSAGVKVTHPNA